MVPLRFASSLPQLNSRSAHRKLSLHIDMDMESPMPKP